MKRATIKRAKWRIDGSVRLRSVLRSPLSHAITAECCLLSLLARHAVGGTKCRERVTSGRCLIGGERQLRVEPGGSISVPRMAALGASSPLPRVPAMVPSPSGLQTFTIVRCKPVVW
jgi:hypothetical protein